MKKWILRFRAGDRANFLEIENCLKTVETRAATEKYRAIRPGDTLVFTRGKSRLYKRVGRVRIFKNIAAMVKAIPFKKVMPSVPSIKAMRDAYYGYPNYREKIKKHGIIALELKE
jgi:ASC-1-like (ASCH) protein